MDIGTFLLTLGLAYGTGVLWYDLLPAQLPDRVWRVATYPLLGIWVAQALLSPLWRTTRSTVASTSPPRLSVRSSRSSSTGSPPRRVGRP